MHPPRLLPSLNINTLYLYYSDQRDESNLTPGRGSNKFHQQPWPESAQISFRSPQSTSVNSLDNFCGKTNKLTYTLETKRKRHDLTPISKSQASSNLIEQMERNQGMFSTYIHLHALNTYTAPLKPTVPSPHGISIKRRRLMAADKTREYTIYTTTILCLKRGRIGHQPRLRPRDGGQHDRGLGHSTNVF